MKKFKVDLEALTDEQIALLKEVHFPLDELKQVHTVQKRTKRLYANGGYVSKGRVEKDDIRYFVMPTSIAKVSAQTKTKKENSTIQEYFPISTLQQECDLLLRTYCTPSATNSMKAAKELEAPKEEPAKEEQTVKALGNIDKSKAKAMYEQQKDANEIAAALGVKVERVIDYLKKL